MNNLPEIRPFVVSFNTSANSNSIGRDFNGIFGRRWSFLTNDYTGEEELYDIENDYHSLNNLVMQNTAIANEMSNDLFTYMMQSEFAHEETRMKIGQEEELSEREREQLRALGYIK